MRLLYLCEADGGGIAEYAIRQVRALDAEGVEVTFLCRPSFHSQRVQAATIRAALPGAGTATGSTARRLLRRIREAREVAEIAAREAETGGYDGLLIACYAEYFAPFWASIYRQLAGRGMQIGTVAHDPVRDFVLGPRWWHRWSVRQAYSFVAEVFVHDRTPVDFGGIRPGGLRVHLIPHGPFEVGEPRRGREAVRAFHGFGERDRVFLSFGQVRDGKNLDRFLRAMVELPANVKLLVAGSGGGGSQRPPDAYPKLARELGVTDRCAFDFRYIPDEETGDLFAAADVVLMAYSAKFRSASGVLNAAVACRKPVLASSGEGPLKSAVMDYGVGVWIAPDDDEAIREGSLRLLADPSTPEWERYERENSWEENARRVIAAFDRRPPPPGT